MPSATALSVNEIRTLHKELGKAMTDESEKDILSLLAKLKEGVVPTEDLIRTTKIGQIVGKLRTNSSASVASQAKALVQGWKAIIDKERAQKGGEKGKTLPTSAKATPPAGKTSAGATPPVSSVGSASPAPSSAAQEAVASPAAPTKPAAPPAGKAPDFEILREKTRNACLKLIFDALKLADVKEISESDSQLFSLALQIESSVYKKFCATEDTVNADYRNKMRSLSLNLKDKNNPQFRRKVVEGRVDASKLVDLTPAEMASEERLAEIRTLEQQNMLVAQSAAELEAETDAFKCGRCKQRKCRYYQKQTRSADEPMTTFVTCTNCNNKWKFC
ncbi:transcription elongation factor [Microstroma glucosiphilum]|uniref:Transcription elongation factor n=1 Tax=Pseudomicrostroma glucosiphilum TaxID=1684307 RepID=A0A316U941_9BASI|nr:transcription elongation factor [Pseudomicrostroma glucosiphilum]PWN21736.1 transcription elongation factor [Pseudomicrostroma glucosiphilum]